jgi:hydroxyacylglutathione hydrolase
MALTLTALPALSDNYIWILSDADRKTAIVVDPGESTPVIKWLEANNLSCAAILITHHHHDHVGGLTDLTAKYTCPVYAPAINNITETTHAIHSDEKIFIDALNVTFDVLAVPGHTLGHVAYYSAPYLFCGDTLFSAGCGRLFEGTAEQMQNSFNKIAALPDDTLICCTHEYTLSNLVFAQAVEPNNQAISYHIEHVKQLRTENKPSLPSSLALEKSINPFLRTRKASVVKAASKHTGGAVSAGASTFKAIRQWKDDFKMR